MFKPAHGPHIWRKKRKKKEEEEDKKDGKDEEKQKNEHKKKESKDKEGGEDKKTDERESTLRDKHSEMMDDGGREREDGGDEDEFDEEVDLKLNFGRSAKREELMEDDEVRMVIRLVADFSVQLGDHRKTGSDGRKKKWVSQEPAYDWG